MQTQQQHDDDDGRRRGRFRCLPPLALVSNDGWLEHGNGNGKSRPQSQLREPNRNDGPIGVERRSEVRFPSNMQSHLRIEG
mmetsp:Transcript_31939/g.36233  ORF Transcript_31939/g.36233 Transcript_31939/m.36233 type:complete len:81 (-) Transcript_31939:820-1062(-)